MEYLPYFLIPAGIVTYVIVTGYIAWKIDEDKASGIWVGFHFFAAIIIMAVIGLYEDWGTRGLIITAAIIGGLAAPFVVWAAGAFAPDIYNHLSKKPKERKVKTLPEQGEYIDVNYEAPVQRTVDELIN